MAQYIDKSAIVAEIKKRIKGVSRLIDIGSKKEDFQLENRLVERILTYEDVIRECIDPLEVKEIENI